MSNWFIVQSHSSFENKVAQQIKDEADKSKISDKIQEIIVPTHDVTEVRRGKRVQRKKKFFPGYVLIRMIMNHDTWHLVKDTDKITGFVGGTPDKPQHISDTEAAYMLGQGEGAAKKSRSTVNFEEGEQVKVIEGPFASFVGTIETVTDKKIKVNVSIFGRPTPVELNFSQVEKVS